MKSLIWLLAVAVFGCAAGDSNFTNVVAQDVTASDDIAVGDDLTVTDDATVTGDLAVTGTTALTGAITATGGMKVPLDAITDTDSITAASCNGVISVSAGIDTKTITLPEASTVIGCSFTIVYIGADGGALVDISPLDSDADGIEGGCTLEASVVTFSGTADADIGLTKATGLTGDYIRLTAVSSAMYAVTGCQGIWANN